MLKNYFKIAWRGIKNNKGYTSLNIMGLAIGIAVALLIGLWAYDQYSYDKFLPNSSQLYRVRRNYYNSNGDTLNFQSTSLKLAETLRKEVPEIEYVVESDWMGAHGLMVGETKLYLKGAQSGSDILKAFQYPLIYGNAATVFNDAYSIVLTESTAKSLFGNENPIGKMVRFDNKDNLKVTGLLKDVPANSTFQFNWIVPFSYLDQTNPNVKRNRTGSFGNNGYQIYVKLKDGISQAQASAKIRNIEHTQTGSTNAMNSYVILEPMRQWHLYGKYENGQVTGGFIEYVKMFSIIGMLVLLIACINFINLTTARSEKRAREVGVRKVVGSLRQSLILQFLIESFLLTLIAFLVALLLVQLSLSSFNTLTSGNVTIPYTNGTFWLTTLAAIVVTALIAGGRPAFYLSSFKPVQVLKGPLRLGRAATLPRKVLVISQFTCSIALIISTIIIYQQVQHAKDRPTGYDINRVLMTNANIDLNNNFTALKNELLQKGIAESVTQASSPATDIYWHSDVDGYTGKQAGSTIEMGTIITSEDYFKTLGMTMLSGRDFTNENDTLSVIFNEAAIKLMQLKNPLSQVISWQGGKFTIVGVVKDALVLSPFAPAEPTMFFCDAHPKGNIMYRLSSRVKTSDAIAQLTTIFSKYNPAFPYDYQFADAAYESKFKMEVLIGKLSGIFAGLAILISCLGLFGLAAYVAEQRTKEIGIRKVLGASVSQVWLLLSKDFIVLVLISCVLASPLAFYFLRNWLQTYSYRIDIGPGVFIIAGILAIVVTLFTISFQAIKAAVSNPVKSLRTE